MKNKYCYYTRQYIMILCGNAKVSLYNIIYIYIYKPNILYIITIVYFIYWYNTLYFQLKKYNMKKKTFYIFTILFYIR